MRATDLTTKRAILGEFARRGSARVLGVAVAVLAAARATVGDFGRGDLLAIGVTVLITGSVEWTIHTHLLHAPEDSWVSRTLHTGDGHRQHHLDPPDVDWILLRTVDAAVFVAMFGLFTAAWSVPLMWASGSSVTGGFLTAYLCAAAGLLHYEWVHLMVHTRYRATSRYYRNLDRRHRLHHFRNEHYWMGVTSHTGDRLMRTLPRERTDVPLSPTARTLAGSDANPD